MVECFEAPVLVPKKKTGVCGAGGGVTALALRIEFSVTAVRMTSCNQREAVGAPV